jgi:hypothetical protein
VAGLDVYRLTSCNRCKVATRLYVPTVCYLLFRSSLLTFCGFSFACFRVCWSRQQAGDALVQLEQEGDAFGVGGVGLFAAAGLVGGVYGGV